MRTSLRKEITIILIIKLMLLTLLWYVCFSHPTAKQLDTQALGQHLIGTTISIKDKPL